VYLVNNSIIQGINYILHYTDIHEILRVNILYNKISVKQDKLI